jgi:hypothetical protein
MGIGDLLEIGDWIVDFSAILNPIVNPIRNPQ